MAIAFKLNGKATTVDVPADMPLLWVLRDGLDMKGTKFGCGMNRCGACTVHVDGEAKRSCVTRIETVEGNSTTTTEVNTPNGGTPCRAPCRSSACRRSG